MQDFFILPKKLEDWLVKNQDVSLSVFLGSFCILTFVLLPFMELTGRPGYLLAVIYTLLFLAGAFTGGLRGRWRSLVLFLAITSIASTWVRLATHHEHAREISLVSSIVFIGIVAWQLTIEVFRPGEINGHRLRGGIAVYLMLGFIFGLTFVLVEHRFPGSFQGLTLADFEYGIDRAVYFSFVSLTTLGFGDITPIGRIAESLVILEAIIGQLYLAILIGRLVSLQKPSE